MDDVEVIRKVENFLHVTIGKNALNKNCFSILGDFPVMLDRATVKAAMANPGIQNRSRQRKNHFAAFAGTQPPEAVLNTMQIAAADSGAVLNLAGRIVCGSQLNTAHAFLRSGVRGRVFL